MKTPIIIFFKQNFLIEKLNDLFMYGLPRHELLIFLCSLPYHEFQIPFFSMTT
jgi:hypothetical protein